MYSINNIFRLKFRIKSITRGLKPLISFEMKGMLYEIIKSKWYKTMAIFIILLGVISCNKEKTEREIEDEFVKKYAPKDLKTYGFTLAVDSKISEVHQLFNDLEANFYFYGDKEEFKRKAARIIELDPKYPSGILMSSFYVTDEKEYKKLVTKAYKLSKKSNLKSEHYIIQAEYYLLVEENYLKAQEYFQKVVDMYPDSAAAIWSLGMAYYYNGDYEEALKCYKKSTQLIPNLPKGYEFIAAVYYRKKEYKKALEYVNKAIMFGAKAKNDVYFSEFESFVYYRNKLYEKALKSVEQAYEYGSIYRKNENLKKVYNLSKTKLDSIKAL